MKNHLNYIVYVLMLGKLYRQNSRMPFIRLTNYTLVSFRGNVPNCFAQLANSHMKAVVEQMYIQLTAMESKFF